MLSETDHPAVGLLRAILADGVFATVPDGAPVFHALPRLSSDEVDDLLRLVCAGVLAHLVRRGIIERGPELTVLDHGFSEREPALAQLAAAASGLPAPSGHSAGPAPCGFAAPVAGRPLLRELHRKPQAQTELLDA